MKTSSRENSPYPAEQPPVDSVVVVEALRSVFNAQEYKTRGRMPLEIFRVMAEHMTFPTLEVVPLRTNPETQRTQVFMYERGPEDPWWPGEIHTPGVVITPDIMGNALPFDQILGSEGELKGGVRLAPGAQPAYVRTENRSKEYTGRGPEISEVYYVEVEPASDEPTVGTFYDVEDVVADRHPEGHPFIEHHRPMIAAAAERFEQDKQRSAEIAPVLGYVACLQSNS